MTLTHTGIDPAEIPALLKAAHDGGEVCDLLLRLTLLAGLRPGEIAGTIAERHEGRWRATVTGGKNPRTITLARAVGEALDAIDAHRTRHDAPLVLGTLPIADAADQLRDVMIRAAVAEPRVHNTRRYLAYQLGHLGVLTVQRIFAYLGVAGFGSVGLPDGWDAEIADLIDAHLVPPPHPN